MQARNGTDLLLVRYEEGRDHYARTRAAVIVLLFYFFISAAILLFGAELNSEVYRRAAESEDEGEKRTSEGT